MRNRLSSHFFVLLVLIGFEVFAYAAIHRSGLIRGYGPSWISAGRDLMIYFPIIVLAFWLSRSRRFKGNWTLYTTAILLFSIGLLVQYRLYSDPEYNAKNKAAARQEKTDTLRMRYINENYDANKRQLVGLPAKPPPKEEEAPPRPSNYTIVNAVTSSYTWIPIFSLLALALAFSFCASDRFLLWIQRNSFIIVLLTLIPLTI